MDKQDNPYMTLIEVMRKQGRVNNPIPYMVGIVTNNMPLLIQVGEVQLERDDLMINESYLLNNLVNGLDYNEYSFKAGEKLVMLISEDQQQFVLLAKVR